METTLEKKGLLELQISDIQISENNPRKTFKEKELAELSDSIKTKGVLQPILVRVKDDKYELVCGERRLRASIMANIETIPCFLRELSDDEAFECMIIENLERKDVHPMEEAEAFDKMIQSDRYTVRDIALKLAKSEQMVIQRLKLVCLIDSIKEDFVNDVMTTGHALLIARQSEANQHIIYSDYKDSWQAEHSGYGNYNKLNNYIDGFMVDLSKAKFDKERTDLNSACISCSVCPKRTGANELLFSDLDTSDRCLDRLCFTEKSQNHTAEQIKEINTSGKEIYFIDYGFTVSDFVREFCAENGIKILKESTEYSLSSSTSNNVEAVGIRVDVNGLLEERKIYLKGAIAQVALNGESVNNPGALKIEKIKEKAVRGLELDQEKITKSLSDSYSNFISEANISDFAFDENFMESIVLYFALTNIGAYQVSRWLNELNIENDFAKAETFEQLQSCLLAFTSDEKKKLIAKMISNNFRNDFPKTIGAKIMRKAFEFNPKNDIEQIEALQKTASDKRIAREKERIAELMPQEANEDNIGNNVNNDTAEEAEPIFKKVSKKYALNNSYFKNARQGSPVTISEIAQYLKEHKELPFEYSGSNWVYDAYIEYQKRNNVYHSQYFTPDATALIMAEKAKEYFDINTAVLDACCGFGQVSKDLANDGFTIEAFDLSPEMVDTYNLINAPHRTAERKGIDEMAGSYKNIISNPPYEVPVLTDFLEKLSESLSEDGTAVLLIPKDFMEKQKPKRLHSVLQSFTILDREDMQESFAHTNWKSEIVVLRKN